MYQPGAFVASDLTLLEQLASENSFVTLISVVDGEPLISHVPVLYRRGDNAIVLRGHFARPNPHADLDGTATAILHGPQHYLSPSWYPDKESAARVPTWNYVVAHLRGELRTYRDESSLAQIVCDLSRHFEPTVNQDWHFDPMDPRFRRQLRGIVGFDLTVSDITFKTKLSQNHPDANRQAAIAALRDLDSQQSAWIADWMETAHDSNTACKPNGQRNSESNSEPDSETGDSK